MDVLLHSLADGRKNPGMTLATEDIDSQKS
jgi:hypothetical protein